MRYIDFYGVTCECTYNWYIKGHDLTKTQMEICVDFGQAAHI